MLRPSVILFFALALPAPAMARTWTDDTGAYTVDAELVGVDHGRAVLRRVSGAGEVRFPLDRLSKADRDFLDSSGALQADAFDPTLPTGVDAKALQAAEAKVKDSIKDDLAAAKTTAKREKIATQLLESAGDSLTGKASQFALYRQAAEIAASLGEAQLMNDAMSGLEAMVKDPTPAWSDVITSLDTRHAIQDAALLTDKLNSLVRLATAKDDYDTALKFCNALAAIGKQEKDTAVQTAARTLIAETNLAKEEWKRIAADREKLKQDPQDEKAGRAVGRFLVLYKGDFDHGLPLLAATGDKPLSTIAAADLKKKKSPEDMLSLGDSWINISKSAPSRSAAQERAAYWYRAARALSDFADRPRVDAKLEPLIQHNLIDLSAGVVFPRDQVGRGYWVKEGRRLSSGAPAGTWNVMKFPDKPGSNYELALDIEYLSDPRILQIAFPVQQRMTSLCFKPEGDGLELVDGKYGQENATTVKPGLLKKGRHVAVRITVDVLEDHAQILVFIDRAKFIAWQGKLASLDFQNGFVPKPGGIYILQADNSNMVVDSARLLNK